MTDTPADPAPDPRAAEIAAKRRANMAKATAARQAKRALAAVAPVAVETAAAPLSETFPMEASVPTQMDRWNAMWRDALTAYVGEPGKAIQRIGDFYDKLAQASKVFFVMEGALAEGRFDPMVFPWPSWEQVSGLNAHGNPVASSAHPNMGLRPLPPVAEPVASATPQADLLTKLAALLGQAPAAQGAPQPGGPTRDSILSHVTGGRPSVHVGEPIRHALA